MIFVFPDYTGGSATSYAPSVYSVDTAKNLVQFVSAGATGTIVVNGTSVYAVPSIGLWSLMQQLFTAGLINGVENLSFVSTTPPFVVSYAPDPASIAGATVTLTGVGFQPGIIATIDIGTGGSGLPMQGLGVVTYISPLQVSVVIPASTAGTYALTLLNPDNSFTVIGITTT